MPASLQLWAVIYSMSLDFPHLTEYLQHLDGISFWVWHGRDLPGLAEAIGRTMLRAEWWQADDRGCSTSTILARAGSLTNEEMRGQLRDRAWS